MSTSIRFIDVADCAKLVRKALKAAHPGVKFSVRSRRYAGGASVDVEWTDGPSTQEVEQTTSHYQGTHYDAGQDLTLSQTSTIATDHGEEVVRYGAHYMTYRRELSPEFATELQGEIARVAAEPFDAEKHYPLRAEDGELHDDRHGEYGGLLLRNLGSQRARPA
jgi:Large polyvalent protein associated domain 29